MTAEIGGEANRDPQGQQQQNEQQNVINRNENDVADYDDDDDGVLPPLTAIDDAAMETTTTADADPPQDNSSHQSQEMLFNPQMLKVYYSRLFPFEMIHSWLSYDPMHKHPHLFSRREFSFTLDANGEEIYMRFQSFLDLKELQDAVMKRQPYKIDLGAIYSHPPKDRKAISNIATQQRELVFDIDLTDYDEVRNCGCSGAKICNICWKFMTLAIKVMDEGLRDDFGFEHVAWFYSGRRGVHAWVCDESARKLSNQGRSSVASYFEVAFKSGKARAEPLPNPLHPALARAYDFLEPVFIDTVLPASGHGLMATKENWLKVLNSLPDCARNIRENLSTRWESDDSTPAEKWSQLKRHIDIVFLSSPSKKNSGGGGKVAKTHDNADRSKMQNWAVELVFEYTYPRLDINVSRSQDHLLKIPFCVHPKTGRVCVPIQVDKVDDFDPFKVPTLPQLMQDLNNFDENRKHTSNGAEWKKTSLKQYFEPFQKNFLEPMIKELRQQEKDQNEQQAAIIGDF